MKVSIITVTYNSALTLRDTIESVKNQSYPNIEHIIIDGVSKDDTVQIARSYGHLKVISEPDKGLFDAMNKGILLATGEVIGVLNSDDFFTHNNCVSIIVDELKKSGADAVHGDVGFVNPDNLTKMVRHFSSKNFKLKKFTKGYTPPHPSFYAKKECYDKYGLFNADYRIAADYELMMRFMFTHKISTHYIDEILVYMRTGGISNKSLKNRYNLNKEIIRACKDNGVKTNMVSILSKYFIKMFEYIEPALKNKRG